ncbi:metabotropic glutamate receptor 8-like [Ruditapes philippinarum]|uniref:metabotropic glutamate receptor 8-like n=1 Tax=Ruditapes philippinarum TaxID=129788 RepID=UPI00295B7E06|nr:metabotropic glutamate receptor 8-like [Ruditapes philippinarum]
MEVFNFLAILTVFIVYFLNFIHSAYPREKSIYYIGAHGNFTWPRKELSVSIDGDIIIGALHMVHERSEELTCGAIMSQGGIQALETMLYTLDHINNRMDILPHVSLGMLAKDDCDRDIYGLEQAVDFIRGSIASIGGSDYTCRDGSTPDLTPKVIPGVIGAPSSVTSIQVANLLKLFKIPQVSFFSTSTVLSNRDRYPYFLRTIPSDVNQAQAMVELVRMFNWTFVSVIYEESSYGIQGFNELEKLLKQHGICLATTEKLLKDSGVPSEEFYDHIVTRLKQTSKAKGVIIFASDQEVGELMKAVRRKKATGMFSWIGSDGWGGRGLAYLGKEEQVEGAITVQPLAFEVKGFKEYFLNLTPFNNMRNPWFVEFWEQNFKCKFPGSSWTPYNEDYNTTCTGTERIEPNTFIMEAQLQFVSDAMFAFAIALHNMHTDLCGPTYRELCPSMDPVDGEALKDYLMHVNFTGLSGQHFQFLPNGDGPARYRILNFRQTSPGVYKWETVGFFDNGHLIDVEDIKFRLDQPQHPDSVCSYECGPGEATLYLEGSHCCWTCAKCHTYQYLPTPFKCEDCPPGSKPNEEKTECVSIPIVYLRYVDALAIGAIAFSTIGIVFTGYVTAIFVKYNDTPVVKASGRELSFVLLFGIFLCYSMTFVLILKPNAIVCGAQKFGIGLCFSVCYSAILIKTNRISRIFRAGKRTAKRPKFISPKSQIFITGSIVAFQNIVGVMWVLLRPPEAVFYFSTRADHQLVCKDAVGGYYMIGFSCPIILVIICTIYAILTRNIPEAFNESKYIGFTMYTTCIIWLAFVPIYFSTAYDIKLRIATMCYSISLSATVTLVCMFTPKLYIILTHPQNNVRKSMATHVTRTYMSNAAQPTQQSQTIHCGYSAVPVSSQIPNKMEMLQPNPPNACLKGSDVQKNGNSISTQTLDSMDVLLNNKDVTL